jgi:hypothetical protein
MTSVDSVKCEVEGCGHEESAHRLTRVHSIPTIWCYECAGAVTLDETERDGEAAYEHCEHTFKGQSAAPVSVSQPTRCWSCFVTLDDEGERHYFPEWPAVPFCATCRVAGSFEFYQQTHEMREMNRHPDPIESVSVSSGYCLCGGERAERCPTCGERLHSDSAGRVAGCDNLHHEYEAAETTPQPLFPQEPK